MDAPGRPAVLGPGDRVRSGGVVRTVIGVSGTRLRLAEVDGTVTTVALPMVQAAADFAVLTRSERPTLPPVGALDGLPAVAVEQALWWERHVVDAPAGAVPKPEYDPRLQSLTRVSVVCGRAAQHLAGHQIGCGGLRHAQVLLRIPATFVYAGIDVERGGLFTGTRGRRIAGRFSLIPTSPFPPTGEWEGLVATLEHALRLHRHTPGTLAALAGYLHQRTGGMIGSLSHLIRGAALDAILDGTEKITKQLLATVDLDHAAQTSSSRSTPPGSATT